MATESEIGDWLAALCGACPGVASGLVLIAPSGDRETADTAVWPQAARPDPRLASLATAALTEDGPIEDAGDAVEDGARHRGLRIAWPLPRLAGARAAVVLELPTAKPDELPLMRERLRTASACLLLLFRRNRPTERLAHGLELMTRALERERFIDAAREVATEAAQRLGCERVAVARMRKGQNRIVALSHNASFDPRSNRVRDMLAAMDEACDQDLIIAAPAPEAFGDRIAIEHERLIERHGLRAACSVPLSAAEETFGALHFEWSERSGAPSPAALESCEDAGILLGPLFARLESADRSTAARLIERARAGLRWLLQPRQMAAKLCAAGLLVALVAFAAAPGRHRIGADASLEGLVRRAVVAGIDGYLAEVQARPGDEVEKGKVLARLDKQDLELEYQTLQARREQTRSEQRQARAEHDLARTSILAAQLAQVEAELDLLAVNLERTELVAPFDGIIVRGDPSQQIGGPVERGEVLFELAPLDGYRIVLEVDERDVRWIEPGQRGGLALAALPGQPRELVIERVTPVAITENGRNVFRVEASLVHADDRLRPGMEGIAKIDAGEGRRIWLWTHDLASRLRLWLWSWWI